MSTPHQADAIFRLLQSIDSSAFHARLCESSGGNSVDVPSVHPRSYHQGHISLGEVDLSAVAFRICSSTRELTQA